MKSLRILCFTPALLILYFSFRCVLFGCSLNGQIQNRDQLQKMLEGTQKYCENVKNIALHYTCTERITDKENVLRRRRGAVSGLLREKMFFEVLRVKRNTYIYDYQLIRKDDVLKEQRILLEENKKKKNKENVELSGKLKYSSQYLVFGPVGFLSHYWQNHFDYEIVGMEAVKGEPAVVIKATPTQEREENCNFGRIWINAKNQVLRLEWEPVSIQNYKDESIQLQRSRIGPIFRPGTVEFDKKVVWTVDYEIEKNGVRFPSRQTIIEKFVFLSGTRGAEYETIKRETIFDYIDYKFFVVETDIEYKKIPGKSL